MAPAVIVCGHAVGCPRPCGDGRGERGAPLGASRRLVGFPLAGWEGKGGELGLSSPNMDSVMGTALPVSFYRG